MKVIRSRDNAQVKRWARLARDAALRRTQRRALIEGPHLVAELLAAGLAPVSMLVSESGLQRAEIRSLVAGIDPVVLADAPFRAITEAESPPGIAAEIVLPAARGAAHGDAVFLEGVQDPSNVGAILRSAAAFGIVQALLDRACADPWSPKTLRAGMGAHFKLALRQAGSLERELGSFEGMLVCTRAGQGIALRAAQLEGRIGWIFGSEGRGVSEALARRARLTVQIPMARGNESLNVAAAAAVCFYEAFSRPAARS